MDGKRKSAFLKSSKEDVLYFFLKEKLHKILPVYLLRLTQRQKLEPKMCCLKRVQQKDKLNLYDERNRR